MAELIKAKTGSSVITESVIDDLNDGGKKSPFSNGIPAFAGSATDATGQIGIDTDDLQDVASGGSVEVSLGTKPIGVEDSDWCGVGTRFGECTVTFTKE